MSIFKSPQNPDDFSRVMIALDGAYKNPVEAHRAIVSFNPMVIVDSKEASDPMVQMCLLTAVNLISRVKTEISTSAKLGAVNVCGVNNQHLAFNFPKVNSCKLIDAVKFLGGKIKQCKEIKDEMKILVGNAKNPVTAGDTIRCVFAGWRCGILPSESSQLQAEIPTLPIAPLYSAALATSECYRKHFEKYRNVGKQPLGISLWDLEAGLDWASPNKDGPELRFLPKDVLIAGLGHLGQAYVWALSMLPYPSRSCRILRVLDADKASNSNLSTSMLTFPCDIGHKKTRIVSRWAELLGFRTLHIEGRVPDDLTPNISNQLTICGFDNIAVRRALALASPKIMLDGGLGGNPRTARAMTIRVNPPDSIWREENDVDPPAKESKLSWDYGGCGHPPGYPAVPFSGVAASAILLSEILRRLHGGEKYAVIVHNLLQVNSTRVDKDKVQGATTWNPGIIDISLDKGLI